MPSAGADGRSEAATLAKAVSLPRAGDWGPLQSRGAVPGDGAGAAPWRPARVTAAALPRARELLMQSQGQHHVCQGQHSRGLLCATQFLNKTGT